MDVLHAAAAETFSRIYALVRVVAAQAKPLAAFVTELHIVERHVLTTRSALVEKVFHVVGHVDGNPNLRANST